MGKPYSEDLRARVIGAAQDGTTIPETAEQLGVSISSVVRFRRLHRETGSVSPAKFGGYKGYALAAHEELVRQLVAQQPDITLAELEAVLAKKKGKYRLRDYAERGDDDNLGLPEATAAAPLIDALHRTLWLMEHQPREVGNFLIEAGPNRDQMRLAAQALAGPALRAFPEKTESGWIPLCRRIRFKNPTGTEASMGWESLIRRICVHA